MSARRGSTALVIGKFLPPHRGHVALVEFAATQAETLHVVVCHSERYGIPGELREHWMERLVPANARVILIDERHADDDSEGWASRTREVLGFAPDVIVSSEEYGERYARHLGSTHVAFDPGRTRWPVSGSVVRAAPWDAWSFLPAPVRGYYACRIAIVGAESSGKTTLARELAATYATTWAPEYGREHFEAKPDLARWTEDDFVHVATSQLALEDDHAERSARIVFTDTTALCTAVWTRRCLGRPSPHVDALAAGRTYDLTLHCEPDFPFVQDGTRETDEQRLRMDASLKAAHREGGITAVSLRGSLASRLDVARVAIDRLLATGGRRT